MAALHTQLIYVQSTNLISFFTMKSYGWNGTDCFQYTYSGLPLLAALQYPIPYSNGLVINLFS
jgi:hypothetical protein